MRYIQRSIQSSYHPWPVIGLKSLSGFKKSTGLWAELRLDMIQTPVVPRHPLLLFPLKRSRLIRPSETQLSVMAVVQTPL